jgi:2-dehydro-3-deoxygluconokinase
MMCASATKHRIAVLGECLIELSGTPFGAMHQTFGGDTLNTAVYLTRLARGQVEVRYLSAMGTDALSETMVKRWQDEGIDTSAVLRDPTRLPGLYLIQIDQHGERTFLYWRSASAARFLLRHPDFERVVAALIESDVIYLTGITLAILSTEDRAKLIALLVQLAVNGKDLVFDSNYRANLWSSVEAARSSTASLLPSIRLLLTTFEDEQQLWGDDTPDAARSRLHAVGVRTAVIKLGAAGCLYSSGTDALKFPVPLVARIVDTTAAGDAFNAAFLAGWLTGRDPQECCHLGNALAGVVIQHCGAIIPADMMPTLSEFLQRLGITETSS